jgi:putative FmdB family regulatory protein
MPTYEFRCPQGHEFEKFYRTISHGEAHAACPVCGKPAERMLSAAGFAFKGSGFYITDYGRDAHREKGTEPHHHHHADSAASGEAAAADHGGSAEKSDAVKGNGAKPDAAKHDGAKPAAPTGGGDSPKSEHKPAPKSEPKPESKPAAVQKKSAGE